MNVSAKTIAPIPEGIVVDEFGTAEAHHRIANSLAVLTGLVRLQASNLAKRQCAPTIEEMRLVLEDVVARISAVALLHRLLSQGPQQGAVDLNAYLGEVCRGVTGALSYTGQSRVSDPNEGACLVDPDQAVSIALVVSELVTNAIKYAHPTGIAGIIDVSCRRLGDGSLIIEVSDDGVGLPEGFDQDSDGSLGLQVVRAMSVKLGAAVVFDSTLVGLTVRLTLPH